MKPQIVTGTLVLPTHADLRFAAVVAGRTLPGSTNVATQVATILDGEVTPVRVDDDVVTLHLTRYTGWGPLTREVASALAVCGVDGWVSDENDTVVELVDGAVVWTAVAGTSAAFNLLTS